jgi:hypothetical protein
MALKLFTRKPKKYTCYYEREDGQTRTISLKADDEQTAREIADMLLEKQYGPQPYKYYLAMRNELDQVVLDENSEPIMTNTYELRYTYPLNKKGEPDSSLVQSNYRFVKCERG